MTFTGFIAVALGAILGAWSRWGLGYLLNSLWSPLPPGTLVANLLGAYVIGFLIELFALRSIIRPEVALFGITGFLGALTTFSTFSAEAVTLLSRGEYFWAVCHITSHLIGSLTMTTLGIATSRSLWL